MLKRNIKNILLITLMIGGGFLRCVIVYAQGQEQWPSSYQRTSSYTYEKDKAGETDDSDSSITNNADTNSSAATNTDSL